MTDCAAAVICSIARHYGRDIPLTLIREAAGTSTLGTSVKGVLDACRTLGFEAGAYKSPDKNPEPLRKLAVPVILHIINGKGDLHFVVLYRMKGKKATIMDPAKGRHMTIKVSELLEMWTGYLVVVTPDPGKELSKTHAVSPLRRMLTILASQNSGDFSLSLLGSFSYIIVGIVTAVFLQHTIDSITPAGDIEALAKACLLLAAVTFCGLAISYGRTMFALRAGLRIDGSLILSYLRSLFRLPAGFFTHRSAGELNSRISDAVKVRCFLTEGITSILTGILILLASTALMFGYSWRLALLTTAFIPLYVLLFAISNGVNRKIKREVIEDAAAFEQKSVECISAIRSIKYFDRGGSSFLSLERSYATLCDSMFRGGRTLNAFATASEAISRIMVLCVLSFGAHLVMNGELTAGELVSFYSLIAYFSSPLTQMAEISDSYNEAKIALERIRDITCLEPEGLGCVIYPILEGCDIVMKDLSFSYPGSPQLLEHFNATFKAGTITAIRGGSGCGKSTLAALLMRDYKPTGGKILAGDADIGTIDLEQWRSYVSIVPQEPTLMNASILDNVTGGYGEPDIEKAVRILDELGLKDFITGLPTGLLTVIGERGAMLSGGQRQRLALARALYLEPKVLILDEATSSLDEISQRYILDKAKAFRDGGGTVIMITHRADNAEIADMILEMNENKGFMP